MGGPGEARRLHQPAVVRRRYETVGRSGVASGTATARARSRRRSRSRRPSRAPDRLPTIQARYELRQGARLPGRAGRPVPERCDRRVTRSPRHPHLEHPTRAPPSRSHRQVRPWIVRPAERIESEPESVNECGSPLSAPIFAELLPVVVSGVGSAVHNAFGLALGWERARVMASNMRSTCQANFPAPPLPIGNQSGHVPLRCHVGRDGGEALKGTV